ncbi:MAG: phage holin family protein [Acidobacteria bacterium]|nr:phage holin family protein [Acidobacteriota bacterium]
MTSLLVRWAISAAAVFAAAYFVPGIHVSGVAAALMAAAATGFINATLGNLIKFFTWPARFLTLGLFSLVINALMLWLAAAIVPGFRVDGFIAAFLGSLVLSVITTVGGWMTESSSKKSD